MTTHRYAVGANVQLLMRALPRLPDSFKVVQQMPHDGGSYEYRIKSIAEPFFRTAKEHELAEHRSSLVWNK
jgi:hypothetical protein